MTSSGDIGQGMQKMVLRRKVVKNREATIDHNMDEIIASTSTVNSSSTKGSEEMEADDKTLWAAEELNGLVDEVKLRKTVSSIEIRIDIREKLVGAVGAVKEDSSGRSGSGSVELKTVLHEIYENLMEKFGVIKKDAEIKQLWTNNCEEMDLAHRLEATTVRTGVWNFKKESEATAAEEAYHKYSFFDKSSTISKPTSVKSVKVITIPSVEKLPICNYWTAITMNIRTHDAKYLTNIPFLEESDDEFDEGLLAQYGNKLYEMDNFEPKDEVFFELVHTVMIALENESPPSQSKIYPPYNVFTTISEGLPHLGRTVSIAKKYVAVCKAMFPLHCSSISKDDSTEYTGVTGEDVSYTRCEKCYSHVCVCDAQVPKAVFSRNVIPVATNQGKRKQTQWLRRFSKSYDKLTDSDEILSPQYMKCNHPGIACTENNNCNCCISGTGCDKQCDCPLECVHRFPGCVCKTNCTTRLCPCRSLNRECDPELCGDCQGSIEERKLPVDDLHLVPERNCCNDRMYRNYKKNLLVRPSPVHGFGAFANERIAKGDFVIEYCGEKISHTEADRRGTLYDKKQHTYLFDLNEDFVIDGTKFGTDGRFINSSEKPNCEPRRMMVNCDHRIGIYALQDIEKDEELFFNYDNDTAAGPNGQQDKEESQKDVDVIDNYSCK